MICSGCGAEIDEDESFCIHCGKYLSKYQKAPIFGKSRESINSIEEKQIPSDNMEIESDDHTKIKNLLDLISKLQAENEELKKELEAYDRHESSVSKIKNHLSIKDLLKSDKEENNDIISRFKKWYNE